ncbi:hypothetical protein LEP1GSC073_2380 [Leptospira noguchii str. Cascata]|nr:hypothetical protein LEP1GSC072_3281 [Leptospira noguchii str. Bonito]EMS87730.1 hypothetical protein LEP1GSC073_2380 [Leptospira noguchii str. Cascata]
MNFYKHVFVPTFYFYRKIRFYKIELFKNESLLLNLHQ